MANWTAISVRGGIDAVPGGGGLRKKLPQANMMVANSTSHGTSLAKKVGGVASRISPPSAPPISEMTNSAVNETPGGLSACLRPVRPMTICAGNSAPVEVMLAARAYMPVRGMRAAQHQRGERIYRAGKARLVEREQRQIRLPADLYFADVVAPEATRRTLGRPAQRVEMRQRRGAVAQLAEHQRVANRFHHVGRIVRGGAVDAEADRRTRALQLAGAANA